MPPSDRIARRSRDPVEVRRSRGEISCAECRRHKLKCNRSIPCSTCIRKGCQTLCPNGTLASGQGRQEVVGDEDTRVKKLLQMSKRIQQLEDALQISHSSISAAPHPLLSDDLLQMKTFVDRPLQVKKESDASEEDYIGWFGTLAMLERGTESYVGMDKLCIDRFGFPEVLHLRETSTVPPLSYPSETFPFSPQYLPVQEIQKLVEEKLPTMERASALVEAYLENISWVVRFVEREQIMEELIPEVYRRRRHTGSKATNEITPTNPHVLSLLLAVFACGAVADLTLSPWNEEANLYFHLARTAISLRPVFDGASLHAVQAIAVLATYEIFSCQKNSLEGAWKMVSFCLTLAASIGLHRDPAHFKLSPKLVQHRRRLFWELHSMDVWKSIGSGRPMAFPSSVVDCELPEDKEATRGEDGTMSPSIWAIRYRHSKEIMAEIAEQLSSARAMKYSEILELDQKLRNFGPAHVISSAINNASASQDGSVRNLLSRFMLVLMKEATMLLLHRHFFVRALIENPTDPARSTFAPSFLSTYRSAVTVSRALRELLADCAFFVTRIWPIWAHALSASVILGSVAACGTGFALAPQAYIEFTHSIETLEKVQMQPLVKDLLPSLWRLRDQAHQALLGRNGTTSCQPPIVNRLPEREEEKEFNPVSGLGRILQKGFQNQFGNAQLLMSGMLAESMSGSMTPSSTTTASSVSESTDGSGARLNQDAADTTGFSGRGSCEGRERDSVSHTARHDGLGPVTESTKADSYPELSQPLLQYANSGGPLEGLQPNPSQSSALHLPGQIQVDHRSTFSSDSSFPSSFGHGPGISVAHDAESDSLPSSNGCSGLPISANAGFQAYASDATHNAENVGFPMDSPQSPFNFDFLSTLSPPTGLNTDFDVSFDMRSSTGDEDVMPLISDDLSAWRTILQDSRFFGMDNIVSDEET